MANFTNLNLCFSVTDVVTTVLRPLSAYSCSEVYFYNHGTQPVYIFDAQSTPVPQLSGNNYFALFPGNEVTIRGITNSNTLSALVSGGSGNITYRTQFFSSFPLTVY